MSRRRPDHRTSEQRERNAEWRRVEVICTGRGTHAKLLFARYSINATALSGLTDAQVAKLSDLDASMLVVSNDEPGRYLVDNFPDVHMTQTFKCPRCSRNAPFKEDALNHRLLALARHGLRTVDLSRLDRVRLTQ